MKARLMTIFAAALLTACATGPVAPETTQSKIVEEGGTGPYKALMFEAPDFAAHTVFAPQDLSAFGKKNKLPVLVWGNGACTNSPWEHFKFLNEIASHGFLVIATGHIPMEEVTDLQRRNAKAVNFGIVYGISSFGLSQDLSISRKEAAQYIDKYFETYPGVKVYLDRLVSEGKEQGYVTTLFGRKRPIPELSSSNFMQRSFGERVAMNSPLQGTAADIMKIAMIRVFERMEKEQLKSFLLNNSIAWFCLSCIY